jgi:outer membrane protein TolC
VRRMTRLIAAGLLVAGTAAAQPRAGEFAADRVAPPPVIRTQATLPSPAPAAPAPTAPNGTAAPRSKSTGPDAGSGGTVGDPGAGLGTTGRPVDALFGPTYPIDLSTALRLAALSSPTIAAAEARVRQAVARVDQADALWLPTLSAGAIYTRHDGVDQPRSGRLIYVSRQGLFEGGGVSLRTDLGEAYFQPLVARRLAAAEAATAQATANNTLFDVASAYFDLARAHAQLQINAYVVDLDQQILTAARSGEKQGLLLSAADVNRAETEVSLRKLERLDLQARAGVASARLVRLLVLDPLVTLVPADTALVPIDLFPPDTPLAELVDQAVAARPELAAALARIEAADVRTRQARLAPLIPRAQINYLGGGFGGGLNGTLSNPAGRSDLDAQLFWELRGLGLGNLAEVRLRAAERDQTVAEAVAVRAQVAAEVAEAARLTVARRASLPEARKATGQAQEMYRILSATSFGMIGPRRQFNALEPLLAVQALNQSRLSYLEAVVEYNRSQFRLLTAVGQPAVTGIPGGSVKSSCSP